MTAVDIEAAVEAGARGWFDSRQAQRRDDSRLDPKTGEPWQWDDVNLADQKAYRALVRPIVVAALDVARGDVLTEAARELERLHVIGTTRRDLVSDDDWDWFTGHGLRVATRSSRVLLSESIPPFVAWLRAHAGSPSTGGG